MQLSVLASHPSHLVAVGNPVYPVHDPNHPDSVAASMSFVDLTPHLVFNFFLRIPRSRK